MFLEVTPKWTAAKDRGSAMYYCISHEPFYINFWIDLHMLYSEPFTKRRIIVFAIESVYILSPLFVRNNIVWLNIISVKVSLSVIIGMLLYCVGPLY